MSVRLTFMCATAGDTSRNAVFGDGLLSEHGLHEARLVGAALPRTRWPSGHRRPVAGRSPTLSA